MSNDAMTKEEGMTNTQVPMTIDCESRFCRFGGLFHKLIVHWKFLGRWTLVIVSLPPGLGHWALVIGHSFP